MKTCTPKSGWITGEVYCRQHGRSSGWPCRDDQRVGDESFCSTCPDHEACMSGWPCWKVKEVNDAG